jgi:hypothetical protein
MASSGMLIVFLITANVTALFTCLDSTVEDILLVSIVHNSTTILSIQTVL